jgi:hypothetical protein
MPGTAAGMTVKGPVDGATSRFYQVHGQGMAANVDAHTGDVLSLLLTSDSTSPARAAAVPATAASARATAEGFLKSRSVSTAGLSETARLVDHGESSEFVVEWGRTVNGAVVPDARVVGVDAATGQVFRYLFINRPFAAPGKPAVSQAAAEKAAGALVGAPGLTVDRTELRVAFAASGEQRLVWSVSLTAVVDVTADGVQVPGHWTVEVDAATGAASIVTTG